MNRRFSSTLLELRGRPDLDLTRARDGNCETNHRGRQTQPPRSPTLSTAGPNPNHGGRQPKTTAVANTNHRGANTNHGGRQH